MQVQNGLVSDQQPLSSAGHTDDRACMPPGLRYKRLSGHAGPTWFKQSECPCMSSIGHSAGAAAVWHPGPCSAHKPCMHTPWPRTVCFIDLVSPCFQRLGPKQGVRSSCTAAQMCRPWPCKNNINHGTSPAATSRQSLVRRQQHLKMISSCMCMCRMRRGYVWAATRLCIRSPGLSTCTGLIRQQRAHQRTFNGHQRTTLWLTKAEARSRFNKDHRSHTS